MKSKLLRWSLVGLVAFFFGVFILPQEIQIIRWMEIDAPQERVWGAVSTVESWDQWDPWGSVAQNGKRLWKDGEQLSFSDVDQNRQRIRYKLDKDSASGTVFLDPKPGNQGVWVKWEHKYTCGYSPVERLKHWLNRGQLALQLDEGLKKLKTAAENTESPPGFQ